MLVPDVWRDVLYLRSPYARQCIFEGDLHHYIFQISYVYFTIIKNTVLIYQACFPPLMMSACVKWAKEHVDGFNALLARQMNSVDQDSLVWTECMNRAKEHADMMSEVGLDFTELVGKGINLSKADDESPVGLGLK
jgi:hypothetical protein